MKIKTTHIIIAVLAVALALFVHNSREDVKIVEEMRSVDTCYIYKTDTVVEYVPKIIKTIITDTVFIETTDGSIVYAPVVQKYFSKKNSYDLWISGVEPLSVDSIKVFNKTSQKIITNEVVRNISVNERKLFIGGGINAFNGVLTPYAVVSFQNKKEWLYGFNLGVYNGNLFYGGSISCRIK